MSVALEHSAVNRPEHRLVRSATYDPEAVMAALRQVCHGGRWASTRVVVSQIALLARVPEHTIPTFTVRNTLRTFFRAGVVLREWNRGAWSWTVVA